LQWRLTTSGFTDDDCTDCETLNGDFVVDWQGCNFINGNISIGDYTGFYYWSLQFTGLVVCTPFSPTLSFLWWYVILIEKTGDGDWELEVHLVPDDGNPLPSQYAAASLLGYRYPEVADGDLTTAPLSLDLFDDYLISPGDYCASAPATVTITPLV
jgi:hypothetical protein